MTLGSQPVRVRDGVTLEVHDSGGAGAPIVFLHGNASRWEHWAPQLEALGADYRCIAFDQRGFGRSQDAPRPSSAFAMAGDIAGLFDVLGVERAHVVALSLGSGVAQAFAVTHADRVASLVLAGTYRFDEMHPTIAAFNAQYAGEPPPIESMGPLLRQSFSERFQGEHSDVVDRFVAELMETPQASIDATGSILDDAERIRAPEIAAPTVVVGGAVDVLAPTEVARHLADSIPGARYVEIDAGHVMNVEAPEAFTALIRSVVDGTPT